MHERQGYFPVMAIDLLLFKQLMKIVANLTEINFLFTILKLNSIDSELVKILVLGKKYTSKGT